MKVQQIYTGCLAEAAYYIESKGEAVIIDPLRETQPYMDKIKKEGSKLKYIFETHFHADFVSGHLELRNRTGADIRLGKAAAPEFPFVPVGDGDTLEMGSGWGHDTVLDFIQGDDVLDFSSTGLTYADLDSYDTSYGLFLYDESTGSDLLFQNFFGDLEQGDAFFATTNATEKVGYTLALQISRVRQPLRGH